MDGRIDIIGRLPIELKLTIFEYLATPNDAPFLINVAVTSHEWLGVCKKSRKIRQTIRQQLHEDNGDWPIYRDLMTATLSQTTLTYGADLEILRYSIKAHRPMNPTIEFIIERCAPRLCYHFETAYPAAVMQGLAVANISYADLMALMNRECPATLDKLLGTRWRVRIMEATEMAIIRAIVVGKQRRIDVNMLHHALTDSNNYDRGLVERLITQLDPHWSMTNVFEPPCVDTAERNINRIWFEHPPREAARSPRSYIQKKRLVMQYRDAANDRARAINIISSCQTMGIPAMYSLNEAIKSAFPTLQVVLTDPVNYEELKALAVNQLISIDIFRARIYKGNNCAFGEQMFIAPIRCRQHITLMLMTPSNDPTGPITGNYMPIAHYSDPAITIRKYVPLCAFCCKIFETEDERYDHVERCYRQRVTHPERHRRKQLLLTTLREYYDCEIEETPGYPASYSTTVCGGTN